MFVRCVINLRKYQLPHSLFVKELKGTFAVAIFRIKIRGRKKEEGNYILIFRKLVLIYMYVSTCLPTHVSLEFKIRIWTSICIPVNYFNG